MALRAVVGDELPVERLIRASLQAIFDVLADPAKHALIDGSGLPHGAPTRTRVSWPWARPSAWA